MRKFIRDLGTLPAFIEPGSPWENGYIESFNGKMRDELLNCEIFDTMQEARVLIEKWRAYYNTIKPHSALEYMTPAPESWVG
jgi:putative transposase